ncbi:hypothetical protein A19Y_1890 [Planktothrix agardhii NIVA-CYA 126/8]|uniref:Uncharacterized protein n=2 Tax=Planktothrix agardhii TaxID=1160 RepID=A0A073CGS9_PLAA1|nr:hypothetical protein A19Y_1890 [Planktothrix agardhii NIVA-CYA 126/8]
MMKLSLIVKKRSYRGNSLYRRGNALGNLKHYQEAISSYQKALQYRPDYPAAKEAKEKVEKEIQALNSQINPTSQTDDASSQ